MWPRPFCGGSGHQNKTPVDHSIGIIPFTSLGGDNKPDKINQNPESLNILCPKQENNVYIFRVPPLIKIIHLFAVGLGCFSTHLHMTIFVAVFLGCTSTGRVGLCFLWFYVQELPKAQPAVVLVLKRLRRRGNGLKSHSTDWEKPGIEPATYLHMTNF